MRPTTGLRNSILALVGLISIVGACLAHGTGHEDVKPISLRIERSFSAPRDIVFGLWTDPQAIAQWFLPPENAHWAEPPQFAVRSGGAFRLRVVASDEKYDLHGTFREVHVPEKLVLNWLWDKNSPLAGSPGNTEVALEFSAHEGRTDLVLTQTGFRNEESRGQYERGWYRCFREIDKLLNVVPVESLTRWKDFIRVSSPVVALEHATVIDGTGAPAQHDQTIVFSEGRITALGPAGSLEIPTNAKRLDLAGYTALPGLVDMHGHLFYVSNFFNTDDRLARVMPFSYPRLYLASGVTTIRTAGSFEPYADLDIKKAMDAGSLVGPKVHVTGPYLTGEGYPLAQLYALTGPEDARRMVEYWAREGATSFKLYTDVTPEEAKAAIEEAHRWGLPVTGHLGSLGFREAAELGIDNVEHGFWVDTEFAPDKQPDVDPDEGDARIAAMDIHGEAIQSMIKTLVEHHVAVTSTIAVWEQFVPSLRRASPRTLEALTETERKMSENSRLIDLKKVTDGTPREKERYERYARMLPKEQELEMAFVRAGGLLLAGSDAVIDAFIAGFGDQREVEMLAEAGFTPEQAIQIASLNGAQFLKESKRIGSLTPGKQADIVIVKGDVSKNIRAIEDIDIVFKDGVGFDPKKLLESVKGQVGIH